MSRYIDSDKLKEKKIYSEERHEYIIPIAELDWAPIADVQEVRHAQWYDAMPKVFRACSFCGGAGHSHYKFCPWCGAKMDGGESE